MVYNKKHTFKSIQKKILLKNIENWAHGMLLKKNRKKKFFPGEHDFSWLDHLKQKNQKYSVSFRDSSGIDVEFFVIFWKKKFL